MMIMRHARHGLNALVAVTCLLLLQGCREGYRQHAGDGEEDEHRGHVIPAHKPRTFPDAVRRLRELNARLGSSISGGNESREGASQPLEFALDIAIWLPEIAADSDMPEEPWNKINAMAAIIARDYQGLWDGGGKGGRAGDPAALLNEAGRTLSELETVLDGANPKWFADKVAASPAPEQEDSR
jgi:hypothetical protein